MKSEVRRKFYFSLKISFSIIVGKNYNFIDWRWTFLSLCSTTVTTSKPSTTSSKEEKSKTLSKTFPSKLINLLHPSNINRNLAGSNSRNKLNNTLNPIIIQDFSSSRKPKSWSTKRPIKNKLSKRVELRHQVEFSGTDIYLQVCLPEKVGDIVNWPTAAFNSKTRMPNKKSTSVTNTCSKP